MNWNNRTLKTPELRIQITNSHIHAKGIWVMHVREFGWNTRAIGVLDNATEQEAQIAAIENVREHLKRIIESLNGL
jgi:flagellar biosynthesis regulator FlaF